MAIPCNQHPKYSGLRKGKKAMECPDCLAYYEARMKEGSKETRNRKPKNVSSESTPVLPEDLEETTVVEESDSVEPETTNVCAGVVDNDDDDDDDVSLDDIQDLL